MTDRRPTDHVRAGEDADHDSGLGSGLDSGLGVSAYRLARTRAEESVVRAAFEDLDSRVRAEVTAPPAQTITDRARRRQVRTARRRVGLAAAAAVVLLGGAAAVQNGFGRDGGTNVVASTPARTPTAAVPTTQTAPTTTTLEATSAPATRTRTVVVTVAPAPATSRRTTATRTRTATPAATPTPAGPTTEVTVYLWQGTLFPTCVSQYAVKRKVPGTGGWKAAVEAALAGPTTQEKAAGYASPFGSGVRATIDEANRTVDFASTSGFADVPPACRISLEQLITRTAADNGSGVTVQLRGSTLLWLNWRAGLA
jgi:hypothetical protein